MKSIPPSKSPKPYAKTVFDDYREKIVDDLRKMGYTAEWKLLNASNFGFPQLRPRVVFVAIRNDLTHNFSWPKPLWHRLSTVGETLYDLMAENGWFLANRWREWANELIDPGYPLSQ